jgi:endogenous inhibitor of DNA gyrase (YacG/DUF329 family)
VNRALTVDCPTCHAAVPWSEHSQWRPFCSARCKGIDLGDWASNRFVIAGAEPTDHPHGAPQSAIELKQ